MELFFLYQTLDWDSGAIFVLKSCKFSLIFVTDSEQIIGASWGNLFGFRFIFATSTCALYRNQDHLVQVQPLHLHL